MRPGVASPILGARAIIHLGPSGAKRCERAGGAASPTEARHAGQDQAVCLAFPLIAALASASSMACAQDVLKLAVAQRGNWDTSYSELGSAQASSSSMLGAGAALHPGQRRDAAGGAPRAASISGWGGHRGRSAPFPRTRRCGIIGAETPAPPTCLWYVKAESPSGRCGIRGQDHRFSGKGSSTDGIVTAYMKQYGLKAIPTATGGPAATLTQVMSGQIDVGCRPAIRARPHRSEQDRVIATGNEPRSSRARPCGS